MEKLTIRDSVPEDAQRLSGSLRPADLREINASLARTPKQALENGFAMSKINKTVVNENEDVIACFGIIQNPFNPDVGMPWFLSSSELEEHVFQLMRESAEWIESFHESFPVLWTVSHSGNIVHHRWLKWSGFNQHRSIKVGEGQKEFIEFIKIKDNA